MYAMTFIIIAITLFGLFLIATETVNRMNKAAVAMFTGVCCWLLYVYHGPMFIVSEHPVEFVSYLTSHPITLRSVKEFIATHIFLGYVAQCAEVVLFLLATTSIVEVLNNNGCFDFLTEWLRTRQPKKLLWLLAGLTFLLSANLDNLATVVLLLGIVHPLISNERERRIYSTVIVLAANCGGAITVIGDLTSLRLWTAGLVTPTAYFMWLVVPVCVALITTLLLMMHTLPTRIQLVNTTPPYRGDDTLLTRPQRLLMLLVGIGGLWFIPTFHRITLLPPFLGALCVLALLWIVNELCNRTLLQSDLMVRKRTPLALQYANLQNILYFIGLTLMFAALTETGALRMLLTFIHEHVPCDYVIAPVLGGISAFLGNLPVVLGSISLFHPYEAAGAMGSIAGGSNFWPLLSYTTAMGGTLLSTGTIAGLLLMRMEGVTFSWYLRHITPKVLAGFAAGLLVLSAAICLF